MRVFFVDKRETTKKQSRLAALGDESTPKNKTVSPGDQESPAYFSIHEGDLRVGTSWWKNWGGRHGAYWTRGFLTEHDCPRTVFNPSSPRTFRGVGRGDGGRPHLGLAWGGKRIGEELASKNKLDLAFPAN